MISAASAATAVRSGSLVREQGHQRDFQNRAGAR